MKEWLPRYVREVADALGLRDYRIDLEDDEERGNIVCTVDLVPGRRYGTIFVRPPFWQEPAPEQRITVLHELLHLHLDPIHRVLLETLGDSRQANPALVDAAGAVQRGLTELAVDAIATAVAPLFPLPPEEDAEASDREDKEKDSEEDTTGNRGPSSPQLLCGG